MLRKMNICSCSIFYVLHCIRNIYVYILFPFAVFCGFAFLASFISLKFCALGGKVRYYICDFCFIPSYIGMYCFLTLPFYFLWPFGDKFLYFSNHVKFLVKYLGLEFQVRNFENFPVNEAGIIVANHQSSFDAIAIFHLRSLIGKCSIIARKGVFWLWPFGLTMWACGVIFIRRYSAHKETLRIINEAAENAAKSNGKLWIFPEGTRNEKFQGELLPFKKGAFRMAIANQIPIIPIVFSPYHFIDRRNCYFGKGKVIIEALKPISTEGLGLEDTDNLLAKVRNLMGSKLHELYEESFKKIKKI